ncbi:MAG: hypothetical protein U9R42_07555 [Bacteroidota bacterium]|nr:hypothetical protein [Bacteroidota bacterium]
MQENYKPPYISSGDAYSRAMDVLKNNFLNVLLIFVVVAVLQTPAGIISKGGDFKNIPANQSLFLFFYWLFLVVPITFGAKYAYLRIVRGQSFEIGDIFSVFKENYLNIIFANILLGFIIGIGILLLIIPGIIFAVRLAFVPYLVTDKGMDAVSAIQKSWEMTRNFSGSIFLMGIMAFLIAIAGLIIFIVGIIPAAMWISVAFAVIYDMVDTFLHEEEYEEIE